MATSAAAISAAAALTRKLLAVVVGGGVAAAVAWLIRERDDESGWSESEWFEGEGEGVVRAGPPVDAPADA